MANKSNTPLNKQDCFGKATHLSTCCRQQMSGEGRAQLCFKDIAPISLLQLTRTCFVLMANIGKDIFFFPRKGDITWEKTSATFMVYFFFWCPTKIYCCVWQASCCVHKTLSDDKFATFCPFFQALHSLSRFLCIVLFGDQHILSVLWSKVCVHTHVENALVPTPGGSNISFYSVAGCSFHFMCCQRRCLVQMPLLLSSSPVSAWLPHSLALETAVPPVLLSSYVLAISGFSFLCLWFKATKDCKNGSHCLHGWYSAFWV